MPWNFQSRPKFKPTTMAGNQAKLGYQLPFTSEHYQSPNLPQQPTQTGLRTSRSSCVKPVTGDLIFNGMFSATAEKAFSKSSKEGCDFPILDLDFWCLPRRSGKVSDRVARFERNITGTRY